jgi:P27 family predicted phage terminase small subunit
MGLRGPSAKPVEIRALEGTDHRVLSFPTTQEVAIPPDDLTAAQRSVWRDVAATFPGSFFKSADRHHLAAYCCAVVIWQQAQADIEKRGAMIETMVGENVVLKPNPWLKIKAQAHKEMVQLGDRLGVGTGKRTVSVPATDASKRSLLFAPKTSSSSSSSTAPSPPERAPQA